jgi:pimeloyl-ACP methyl ester carboxylesterase
MICSRAALISVILSTASAEKNCAQEPTLVRVDGRQVEVIQLGTGSPTLVLESGGGEDASQWKSILPALAKETHVIAYSRAGFGKSDPARGEVAAPSPQSSVRDLHQLLQVLGERAPVVLAGHSWGGLLARLYASTYPSEVAGLVLIDGTHESQFKRWQEVEPAFNFADSIRALTSKMPPRVRAMYEQLLEIQAAQRVDGMKPLVDMPLAVITAVKQCPPDGDFPCRSPRALAVWRQLHDEWFARSTDGLRLVSSGTAHYVMNDQPSLITTAVRFVVDEVRARPH